MYRLLIIIIFSLTLTLNAGCGTYEDWMDEKKNKIEEFFDRDLEEEEIIEEETNNNYNNGSSNLRPSYDLRPNSSNYPSRPYPPDNM